MQVTKHFKMSEFACKDGTQVPEKYQGNVAALCLALEHLRARLGSPVVIISGYRTKEYNRRVGGASKSKHLTASAADVRLSGKSPADVSTCLDELIAEVTIPQGGIGVYPSQNVPHDHIRPTQATWDRQRHLTAIVPRPPQHC